MLRPTLLMLAGLTAAPALAADDEGIPLTVQVIDNEGEPIRTATVRHPEEKERHRVNAVTGTWTESVLYMLDGSEMFFEKGTPIKLEISAPGYQNEAVEYTMRRRRNKLVVQLDEIEIADDDWQEDAPIIQFDRDEPID